MRAEGQAPNLINGVSRQTAELRLSSQLEESTNQFPSISSGLQPRSPAILKSSVYAPNILNEYLHSIDRDPQEQYNVRISPTGISVNHEDGTPRTVNAPDGYGYLAGATKADYFSITVADSTFILNKKKAVQKSAALSPAKSSEALFHVASGEYRSNYKIFVNGALVAHTMTTGGPFPSTNAALNGERNVKQSRIVEQLISGVREYISTPGDTASWTSNDMYYNGFNDSFVGLSSIGAGWTITAYDNVIHLKRNDGTPFTASFTCSGNETAARCHMASVDDFAKLPNNGPNGFVIKVTNSSKVEEDDYYVKLLSSGADGSGKWEETVAPSSSLAFDASTMPHRLVREADGTFTFKKIAWDQRAVGDDNTNPFPSFTGNPIETLTFFKRRLGLMSGESYSFSRVGELYNFFSESALTGLDTDPVDGTIDYDDISTIRSASATDGGVILLTDSVPFLLSGGDVFSYRTANVDPMLAVNPSKAPPVSMGDGLFFLTDLGEYSAVHELRYDRNSGVKEAPDISEHVPGYIPPNVTMTCGDSSLRCLFLYSTDTPNQLIFYRWLVANQNKVQSAWQKWALPVDNILSMKIVKNDLVLSTKVGNQLETVTIDIGEGQSPALPEVLLDRRVVASGTYNAASGLTTWVSPYSNPGAAVIASGDRYGETPDNLVISGTSVTAEGDWSASPLYLGNTYESSCELSPIVYRSRRSDGSEGMAVPGMNLTVAAVSLLFVASSAVSVTVTKDYRPDRTQLFSAALKGTKTGIPGDPVVGKIDARVSILANANDFTMKINNNSPFSYSLVGLRWTGTATQKSY